MRKIVYTLVFSMIMVGGMFIGMVKGQEVRNRWVSKMRFKHEEGKQHQRHVAKPGEIMLDEIEEATYHG